MAVMPARAHVFVADLDELVLDPGDARHLGKVLRLRVGEAVTASDGAGGWRICVVATAGDRLGLEATGPAIRDVAPQPTITVGFALTKSDKPEVAVQKLTEAGVDVIVPFVSARSVVRWDDDKADRNRRRLETIGREAAMQCRRTRLPDIRPPVPFDAVLAGGITGVALADHGGGAPSLDYPCVLVGPEGGWSEEERGRGLPIVGLGDQVFRAETAAVAAGILLCALRSGLVSTKHP